MIWLSFQLNGATDSVSYITSDSPAEKQLMRYKKFIEFIAPYCKTNYIELENHINSCHMIILFCETGKWEVVDQKSLDTTEVYFNDLVKLNEIPITENKRDLKSERVSKQLENIFKGRRNDSINNGYFRR